MGRAASVLGARRAITFVVLVVALGLYYRFHDSLPDTSTWGDVAVLSFLLMPAVLLLVYLVLPLREARELQLFLVALAFAALAVILHQADLNTLSDFAKLGAMTFAAFWFLNFFEALSWVVLVACIIPLVDIVSVWKGPTHTITTHHFEVYTAVAIAFLVPGGGAAYLGPPDVLFYALFLGAAARWHLRVGWTWFAMTFTYGLTIVIAQAWHKGGLPALPFLSAAFIAANADLLWRAIRRSEDSSASPSSSGDDPALS